jgi:hypothetical protein
MSTSAAKADHFTAPYRSAGSAAATPRRRPKTLFCYGSQFWILWRAAFITIEACLIHSS